MWRVFFTSAIVAVVVRTAMGWCKTGKCGHFGAGGFIIWDISGLVLLFNLAKPKDCFWVFLDDRLLMMFRCSGQEDYSFQELLPMAVIGVIGGLLGWCFS